MQVQGGGGDGGGGGERQGWIAHSRGFCLVGWRVKVRKAFYFFEKALFPRSRAAFRRGPLPRVSRGLRSVRRYTRTRCGCAYFV